MAEMVESALTLQVKPVKTASQKNMTKRSDLMIVAERVNLRAQHPGVNLGVPVFAAQVIRAGKISRDTQPPQKAIVRIPAPAHHGQLFAGRGSRGGDIRERSVQNPTAKLEPRFR